MTTNRLACVLPILFAGCGVPPFVEESAAEVKRCDKYTYPDCSPEGPRGQLLCTCILRDGYDCDPLTERNDVCTGEQPQKCVLGHWQNDGAACFGGEVCDAGKCLFPGPASGSPATLSYGADWNRRSYTVASPPGQIPLLVVYVHWYAPYAPGDGSPDRWYEKNVLYPNIAHATSYYDGLLFGGTFPSANQYYADISLGRFQWTKAGEYGVFGQLKPSDGSGADNPPNLNRIVTLASGAGFRFAPYDTNHDGKVTPNELTLMMISDNGGRIAGANRPMSPNCQPADGVQVCSEGDRGVVEIEDEVQFATLVHEMSHTLGNVDLYGSFGLDYRSSLMGPTIEPGGADLVHTWWLDPWHRHQLGWTDGSPRDFDRQALTVGEITHPDTLPRGRAAFVWDSSRGSTEYFILEYRDQSNYDRDSFDRGIAVWSVKEGSNRGMVSANYDGRTNQPGVVSYNVDGSHGGCSFLKKSNGWLRLSYADGTFSGFQVQATDDAGSYQLQRIN